ncbi:hypothetical protein Pmar_PMAR028023 [Perkinsus marinus ATCC 50983]|uniref:Uncharacterized protein n=1 Tax=Perkinsus marinus (strain ATCC 50983 / TXsc) TaxID=423536 RepID=C5LVC2_PERM5|nr:hypothetical protein Pmar_PMAR028023 [Perkinsus marinus ATCC 50983]EEQ99360.1 hypothetical protein Pmar_PMAR028023 [Perkinsus marinus ATCC 50983]|eukprot:XP_002766643.1 hypothetical protein Pmar_PMAR028023 [Perkinsus marinus ATCC 50983]
MASNNTQTKCKSNIPTTHDTIETVLNDTDTRLLTQTTTTSKEGYKQSLK